MAKITGQLRTGVESREEIRRNLDPQIAQLIERLNLLIERGWGPREAGEAGWSSSWTTWIASLPQAGRGPRQRDALCIDVAGKFAACGVTWSTPCPSPASTPRTSKC